MKVFRCSRHKEQRCKICTLKDPWEKAEPMNPIMKYFEYEHLPEKLKAVSQPFCIMARDIDVNCPDGPEKSAGLRKLLEAKDCIVRASL
jgi:hypothetical protein